MSIFLLILCGGIGYLLGNIQTGLIIGKLTRNIDLRKHGSGSSGATNALRILGSQSAAVTLLGDLLKGAAAAGLGRLIAGWEGGLAASLLAVAGHIWPVFYGFRGGKGAATSLGTLLVLTPLNTLILLAVGAALIVLTRMVSVASVSAAVLYMILAVIRAVPQKDWFFLAFGVLLAAMVVYAHRGNIRRILAGTENKLSAAMFRQRKK